MKPVSLLFQCFGPYREAQTIDFSLLEKNGLFLISGETGSGKTTILDAICCALYGETSNKSRGDLEAMRFKQAEKTEETRVEFVFDSGGRRYKFVRTLRYGYKNIVDEHNCLEYRDGVYVPLFENPKKTRVNEKACELIGLSAEQFRQVIVLPQGKFETLLVSDSLEKANILTSIFHADRWDRIAEYIKETVKKEGQALELQTKLMEETLASYKCEDVDALARLLAATKTQALEAKTRADALGREKKAASERLIAARMQNEVFTQYDAAVRQQKALSEKNGAMQSLGAQLEAAQRAQQIGAKYDALSLAQRADKKAQADALDAETKLKEAQQKLLLQQDNQKKHEQAKEPYLQQIRMAQKLSDAREAYDAVTKTAQALRRAREDAERDEKTRADREQKEKTAQEKLRKSDDALNAAVEQYKSAREGYMLSVSGNLAESLENGKPCPVCGSIHHPHPAQPPQDGVTQQELEAVEAEHDALQQANRAARKQHENAAEQLNAAKDACAKSSLALQQAQSDDSHAHSRLIEGIETVEQLEAEIARLQTKINLYEKEETALQTAVQDAKANYAAKEKLLERAREERAAAQQTLANETAAWDAARGEAGFAGTADYLAAVRQPQQMQKDTQTLAQYKADCETAAQRVEDLRKKVSGQTRPDVAEAQEQERVLEDAWNKASNEAAVLAKICEEMRRACDDLQKKAEDSKARGLRLDENKVFLSRIVGSNGVSLKRYVLGMMLTSVTEQANEILRGIYGGRYSLIRSDEATGGTRSSGLELEVLDRQGNVRRSVKTLSGGEKFLAALSLAIGLSTVVQSQTGGVRLDAMFIDEGFGTLDRNTMQDALDVLQSVQQQSAIVGIISHVEALRENIPAQIEIIKEKNGSRCTIHGV